MESPQQHENVSSFPPPPPFYKLYINYDKNIDYSKPTTTTTTTDNDKNINKQDDDSNNNEGQSSKDKQQNEKDNEETEEIDEMNIDKTTTTTTTTTATTTTTTNKKIELNRPLAPPIPPKMGTYYKQYGFLYSTVDIIPPLEESLQLYPKGEIDPIVELKKLNRSILFNYLQLLETLIENPANFEPKIEDISRLFINFHHLLNSYRPHQARETLLSIMNEQIKQKTQSNDSIKKALDVCKESLLKSFKNLNNDENTTTTTTTTTNNISTPITPSTPTITTITTINNTPNNKNNNNQDVNMNENNETTNWMDQLLDEMLKIN